MSDSLAGRFGRCATFVFAVCLFALFLVGCGESQSTDLEGSGKSSSSGGNANAESSSQQNARSTQPKWDGWRIRPPELDVVANASSTKMLEELLGNYNPLVDNDYTVYTTRNSLVSSQPGDYSIALNTYDEPSCTLEIYAGSGAADKYVNLDVNVCSSNGDEYDESNITPLQLLEIVTDAFDVEGAILEGDGAYLSGSFVSPTGVGSISVRVALTDYVLLNVTFLPKGNDGASAENVEAIRETIESYNPKAYTHSACIPLSSQAGKGQATVAESKVRNEVAYYVADGAQAILSTDSNSVYRAPENARILSQVSPNGRFVLYVESGDYNEKWDTYENTSGHYSVMNVDGETVCSLDDSVAKLIEASGESDSDGAFVNGGSEIDKAFVNGDTVFLSRSYSYEDELSDYDTIWANQWCFVDDSGNMTLTSCDFSEGGRFAAYGPADEVSQADIDSNGNLIVTSGDRTVTSLAVFDPVDGSLVREMAVKPVGSSGKFSLGSAADLELMSNVDNCIRATETRLLFVKLDFEFGNHAGWYSPVVTDYNGTVVFDAADLVGSDYDSAAIASLSYDNDDTCVIAVSKGNLFAEGIYDFGNKKWIIEPGINTKNNTFGGFTNKIAVRTDSDGFQYLVDQTGADVSSVTYNDEKFTHFSGNWWHLSGHNGSSYLVNPVTHEDIGCDIEAL